MTPENEQAASDNLSVDIFACIMKDKLAKSRAKGRAGWEQCDPTALSAMLREHVEKGDPVDVANFCMMLWHHRVPIMENEPIPIVGLGRMTDEEGGIVTLKFENEDRAQQFMRDYAPSVEVDLMPEKTTRTVWVNLYKNGLSTEFVTCETEEEAFSLALHLRSDLFAVAVPVEIAK